MNLFDIAIIVVLGYCIIRGVFRGLIKEVASIAGLLAGFYAAYTYHGTASHFLSPWITEPAYLSIAGFVVVFCGVFFSIMLVSILIRMVAKAAFLGVADRIFGAVFGALKAVLVLTLIYILLVTVSPVGGIAFVRDSKLAPPVVAIGRVIVDVMPKGVKDTYDRKMEEFKKGWSRKS
ncbi:MAG: CvpA family protein [Desulfobacteraceae bacterium]|nr:MAG: CvpA family protein [Desulfobacteraceae bacterium]